MSKERKFEEVNIGEVVSKVVTDKKEKEQQTQNGASEMEKEFSKMENETAQHTPEESETDLENPVGESVEISVSDKVKIRMFLGFFCWVLVGVNLFVLNKVTKHKVPFSKMELEEHEVDALVIYLENPEILDFINKINPAILFICHFEYMIFTKFNSISKDYEIEENEE